MNEIGNYKELVRLIEQMMKERVQLIHGGQIIDWNDTKIPEIIREIKKGSDKNDRYATFSSNDN